MYRQRALISIEVEFESESCPSSREEWIIANAIEKAALRCKMPKGCHITLTQWPISGATKLLKFEQIDENPS